MRARGLALVLASIALVTRGAPVLAADTGPSAILPQELHWLRPPGNPAVEGAWVVGKESEPGSYLFRVRLAAGGRIPPHTHPDARSSTVLAGTLYVGFGSTFDEAKTVAVPTGAVYVAPARTPHYVWAKDGPVVYQEAGTGPTATVPLP
jgi:quercetin dioxygenase-like cupin family protein